MTRTNMDRANEALKLCATMQELTGVDELQEQVSDIICHLRHMCRLIKDEEGNDLDFDAALHLASINFWAEVSEDPDALAACEGCGNTLNDGSDICDQCGGQFKNPT
jgi:hypothetical protein